MYRFILSSLYCTSLLALIVSLPLLAKETPKAYAQCIACHGENGEGNAALSSPAIAGLSEQYLSRQLKNYASGKRGYESADSYGQQMAAISKSLDLNKDVPELAKYIATLPKPTIEQKVSGDLKNGHRYYHAKCGACHGGQGQGNSSFKAPKLAGQHFDYLARQMQNFSQGMRGKHPDDKYGRQMAMMARTVSDKEIADILFFISQQ